MESRKSESQSERAQVARGHHFFERAVASGYLAAVLCAAPAAWAGNAPVIVQQPFPQTVATGSDIMLEAGVTGDSPMTYTWLFNGTNLPSGTDSTLFLPAMQAANAGNYQLVAANSSGMATSAVTLVRVTTGAQVAWSNHLPGSSVFDPDYIDFTPHVVADAAGNAYVAGSAIGSTTNHVFQIAKLSAAGQILWTNQYAGAGFDNHLTDLILDGQTNVYVTGSAPDSNNISEFVTIKFSTDGQQLWAAHYGDTNSVGYYAFRLGVDGAGNVYAAGTSYYTNYVTFPFFTIITASDYAVVKLDSTGNQLWDAGTNLGLGGQIADMAVDAAGNVVLAGTSGTIKLDASGSQIWDAPVVGLKIKQDSSGNSYLLTLDYNLPNMPVAYQLAKVDPAGNILWTNSYSGPGYVSAGQVDLALTSDGSCLIAGKAYEAPDYFYLKNTFLTVKYDTGGHKLWASRFAVGSTNSLSIGNRIAVDGAGNAYVSGESLIGGTNMGGFGQALTTVKYDPNGNERWTAEYLNTNGYSMNGTVALDAATNVIVAGYYNKPDGSRDFAAVKYIQSTVAGAPVITTPPQSQIVLRGTNVTLGVVATGGPLTYQWLQAATNLPGATNATLVLSNLQPADCDEYSVMVQNAVDTTISPVARVGLHPQLTSPTAVPPFFFSYSLTGDAGPYQMQSSPDLLNWSDDFVAANTNGTISFTNSRSGQYFYRAKKLN